MNSFGWTVNSIKAQKNRIIKILNALNFYVNCFILISTLDLNTQRFHIVTSIGSCSNLWKNKHEKCDSCCYNNLLLASVAKRILWIKFFELWRDLCARKCKLSKKCDFLPQRWSKLKVCIFIVFSHKFM